MARPRAVPACHVWVHSAQRRGYFWGFKTLEKSYLLRVHGKIVERPQHMIMRAACGIHCGDLKAALETYDLMSRCGLSLMMTREGVFYFYFFYVVKPMSSNLGMVTIPPIYDEDWGMVQMALFHQHHDDPWVGQSRAGSSSPTRPRPCSMLVRLTRRCPRASCWKCRGTASMASMTPWSNVPWSPNLLVALEWPYLGSSTQLGNQF